MRRESRGFVAMLRSLYVALDLPELLPRCRRWCKGPAGLSQMMIVVQYNAATDDPLVMSIDNIKRIFGHDTHCLWSALLPAKPFVPIGVDLEIKSRTLANTCLSHRLSQRIG